MPANFPAAEWTFNGASSESLGLAEIRRERRSHDADTLTFTAAGRNIDAAPLFAYGQTVSVQCDGVSFFYGTVTQTPATGTGEREDQSYTLSGPWWNLEHTAARQQWQVSPMGSAPSLSGRIILGQGLDGTRLTTGQTITALLEYAQGCGAPLSIGAIDPSVYAPLDEVKDVTVASAIINVLRWHPDCVTWFDYSSTPPTLNIRSAANLTAVAFTLGVPPLTEVSAITPRYDLQVPAVVIHYEQTGSSNGKPTFNITVDAAPTGATGSELNALCVTIPLRGATTTSVEQRIETRGIRDNLTTYGSDEIRDYLLAFVPELRRLASDPSITVGGITITDVSRALTDTSATQYDPDTEAMVPVTYDATLNNHLVRGGITDWMIAHDAIRTQEHTITFNFTADSTSGDSPTDLPSYNGTLAIRATNAGSGADATMTNTYVTLTDYSPGDAVPTGLAAACYAAFNRLQFSGSVKLVAGVADGATGLGNVLNLLGSAQAAWATMAALITAETVDVDSGTTKLTFGPAEHLSPGELVDLMRVARPNIGGRTAGSPAALGTGMSDVRTGNT